MIILGVDPGTVVTGYGVIEAGKDGLTMLTCGAISNSSDRPIPLRLKLIHERLSAVIREFAPDEFAIETAFYGKNAQSALKLGQARGAAIVAAVGKNIPVSEYSPREVKKAIVGGGNASKQQVQYMVQSLLKVKSLPAKLDVSDALAVAICHFHRTLKPGRKTFSSWKAFVVENPDKVSKR